jgi:hypothetical protein
VPHNIAVLCGSIDRFNDDTIVFCDDRSERVSALPDRFDGEVKAPPHHPLVVRAISHVSLRLRG